MSKKYKKDPSFSYDIMNEVNKFDKKFGVRLKHPNAWREPEEYRLTYIDRCKSELTNLVCILNGVDPRDYYGNNFLYANSKLFRVTPMDYDFSSLSNLEWYQNGEYPVSSTIFKSRYLTYILTKLLDRFERISERRFKGKKHEKYDRILMMDTKLMRDIVTFINAVYYDEYKNIMIRIHNRLTYGYKSVKARKINKLVTDISMDCRGCFQKGLFSTSKIMPDDLILIRVFSLAYYLVTDNHKGTGIPKFKKVEGKTTSDDLLFMIEKLGEEIIKSHKNYNVLFKAFITASPKITSSYGNQAYDNEAVRVGIIALTYTKFFMNDKNIDKFIDEILN